MPAPSPSRGTDVPPAALDTCEGTHMQMTAITCLRTGHIRVRRVHTYFRVPPRLTSLFPTTHTREVYFRPASGTKGQP